MHGVDEIVEESTEPLPNGAKLPEHPASTTSLKVVKYGKVWDDADGKPCIVGLHENEMRMLMAGDQMALQHLYCYAIRGDKIYHTRPLVVVDVDCVPA